MKRLRLARCSGQLLRARPATGKQPFIRAIRCLHAEASASDAGFEAAAQLGPPPASPRELRVSAKLAALHARLALPESIPLQTLARTLITMSAQSDPKLNNSSLAYLGSTIIRYHAGEYLICKWPRLPMTVFKSALQAYAGNEPLMLVGRQWGVELAAAPGEEVDPGLLQWTPAGSQMVQTLWGNFPVDSQRFKQFHRRGFGERINLDVEHRESTPKGTRQQEYSALENEAIASFVQAVVGSIYTHSGREAAKTFVASHIMSRQLDPSVAFEFKLPTRELALLCAREGFEAPLARLESETGRLSRTPVYLVGIYSGSEKIGEGSGPSLDIARRKACINALKAWYLYSPGNQVRVPSDTMVDQAEPWTAPHIDVGEII